MTLEQDIGYNQAMKLSLQLADVQAKKLRDHAERLGLDPEQLAQACASTSRSQHSSPQAARSTLQSGSHLSLACDAPIPGAS